jgi:hypothetical protein
MKFCEACSSVEILNSGNALKLAPAALSMSLHKALALPDPEATCNHFDVTNLVEHAKAQGFWDKS